MKNRSGGFTVAEFMVALLLLALVIVMAISLFVSQGGMGREVSKKLSAGEQVSMALMVLRQDIMHAGLGVDPRSQFKKLNIVLAEKTTDNAAYKELYLAYGMDMSLDPDGAKSVYVQGQEINFTGTGSNTYPPSTPPLPTWRPEVVGGFIGSDGSVVTIKKVNPTSWELTGSLDSSTDYVPAIVWKRMTIAMAPGGTVIAALVRNFEKSSTSTDARGSVVVGGEPRFTVTDFRVRARFYGGSMSPEIWSPTAGDPARDYTQLDRNDLRGIEVTIKYRVMTGKDLWSETRTRTITVAPRVWITQKY